MSIKHTNEKKIKFIVKITALFAYFTKVSSKVQKIVVTLHLQHRVMKYNIIPYIYCNNEKQCNNFYESVTKKLYIIKLHTYMIEIIYYFHLGEKHSIN